MLYFPLDPSLKLKRIDQKQQNKENYSLVTKASALKRAKPNNEKQLGVLQYNDEDIFKGNLDKSTEMLK